MGTACGRPPAHSTRPRYDLEGWLQAGALRFGRGRVVFLAEAAMCTAQVFRAGTDRAPRRGMNAAMGKETPVFCLNVVRWLSGLLPPRGYATTPAM